MHPVIENFLDRPRGQKIAFWVASLAIVAALFWQYGYRPQLKEQSELTEKIDGLQRRVTQERRIARDLPRFRQLVKELQAKLLVALKELPDKREIPELLSSISNLARDAGLEVALFQPKPEAFREFYAEVPVTLTVEGNYHQLATFFDEVGNLARIVNLSTISIWQPFFKETGIVRGLSREQSEKKAIRSTATAMTFRYLEESERVQQQEPTDDKKRRRKK